MQSNKMIKTKAQEQYEEMLSGGMFRIYQEKQQN